MILKMVRIYSDEDTRKIDFNDVFHIQAESMCDMFSSLLSKKKIRAKAAVINITCKSSDKIEDMLLIDGFLDVDIAYNLEDFNNLSEQKKRSIQLEIIMLGLRKASSFLNLNLEPFIEVQNEIVQLNYLNRFIWKKPKYSPDRKKKAYIQVEWGTQTVKIDLVVTDKKGDLLLKQSIPVNHPGRMGLDILGSLNWLDNDIIEIRHQYIKKEVYKFTIV
ncbi:hypothetical protein X560_1982 [Listeria fleischmannii 1991]|uniref:Uncharacterized protein n=2 Tax=Listeria fleischmannii TaxID=1069827 RepID=A0A2X3JD86_9LIST|nr:hypothetical protein [Listeria fleischmannii]KMT58766.1 hypothetical protein X560_1982 [Listeria fleischmannii 1991]SQC71059.1 Uncharacterised protein [Listeria fleischmannii subsp. fleischmannii]